MVCTVMMMPLQPLLRYQQHSSWPSAATDQLPLLTWSWLQCCLSYPITILNSTYENPESVLGPKDTIHTGQKLSNYSMLHLVLGTIASILSMNSREGATLYMTVMSHVKMIQFSARVERTYLCLLEHFAQHLFQLAWHPQHNWRCQNHNKQDTQFLLKASCVLSVCGFLSLTCLGNPPVWLHTAHTMNSKCFSYSAI